MPARIRPTPALAAASLVALAAALPAPAGADTLPDRTGYQLTETGWDGTGAQTATVDARDGARTVVFGATVRDAAGRPADQALAAGFLRSATSIAMPFVAFPATTVVPGRTSFALAVAKGSQTLVVAVPRHPAVTEPFTPQGDAAASVTASLVVRATTTAVATTRRVAAGARIAVRGRLDGRAGDPTGTVVRLQLRRAGAWRTIGSADVRDDVRWRAAVRLPRTVHGHARLRAVVLPSATCPYSRGPATPLTVAVR